MKTIGLTPKIKIVALLCAVTIAFTSIGDATKLRTVRTCPAQPVFVAADVNGNGMIDSEEQVPAPRKETRTPILTEITPTVEGKRVKITFKIQAAILSTTGKCTFAKASNAELTELGNDAVTSLNEIQIAVGCGGNPTLKGPTTIIVNCTSARSAKDFKTQVMRNQ